MGSRMSPKSRSRGILASEALKNPRKDLAWTDFVERLAVPLGIDPPGHCLPSFIANQADRKLVATFAGNDGRASRPLP